MLFKYAKGATPLSPDEIHNLVPNHLTIQSQLDEWEQYNITRAMNWVFNSKRNNILTIKFATLLHRKMFNTTWLWAGSFRKSQTNIGINRIYIPQELKTLFDDVQYWFEHQTYSEREIAVRLHHRLVYIHPFPNGNGRFSRLMADLLIYNKGQKLFTWGKGNLAVNSSIRDQYLSALRKADKGDYLDLINFADSSSG